MALARGGPVERGTGGAYNGRHRRRHSGMDMRGHYLLLLALFAPAAAARVYQWVDPDSGNVYLSGTPPAWYRSGTAGPRVLVFDEGKLVDDTRREMSEEQAQALREEALAAEQARREAAEAQAAAAPEAQAPAPLTAGEDAEAATKAQMQALVEQYLKSVLVEKLPLLLGGPPASPATAGAEPPVP